MNAHLCSGLSYDSYFLYFILNQRENLVFREVNICFNYEEFSGQVGKLHKKTNKQQNIMKTYIYVAISKT